MLDSLPSYLTEYLTQRAKNLMTACSTMIVIDLELLWYSKAKALGYQHATSAK
jgi:hypothetical protein